MRGEKTITFDFPIRYSKGGSFLESSTITVREPGLGKFHVWQQMKSYAGQARPGILRMAVEMEAVAKKHAIAPVATDDEGEHPEVDPSDKEAPEPDVLELMATGLGDKYVGFVDYVRKELTNSPKLAFVGEGELASPITDAVWTELDEHGGMDAVARVIAAFAGFFLLGRPTSPKANGVASSPTSPSPRPASLSTKPRKIHHSAN